jgi:hypothetical protein
MQQGAETSHTERHPLWGAIRNPDDLVGGLALIGIALFAFYASYDLPGMRGFAFGPGTAPRLFATLLLGFGVAVVAMSFFTQPVERPEAPDYARWRETVLAIFANAIAFVILYALLMVALYVIDYAGKQLAITVAQAGSAAARSTARDIMQILLILEIGVWIFLIIFAYMRGSTIGHTWIAFFPALGAFLDIFGLLRAVPYLPLGLNLACIAVGYLLPPRVQTDVRFSLATLIDLPARIRGPLFVTASIIAFAVMIRPIGLIISSFLVFMISGLASKETRWIECTIAAIGLTTFCVLLFVYLLNLPFQLWPRF